MREAQIVPISPSLWAGSRPRSRALAQRARALFPAGVTHDSRYLDPFGNYIERALGARKWDVDGHEYIDYWGGHGSLLLGHSHPAVVEAVSTQAALGTHYGGNHELEVEWGELVKQLVPSAHAGLVRFFSSGTEATLMAIRMVRAATLKPRLVLVRGHFHGWHDYASVNYSPDPAGESPLGVPAAVASTVVTVPPDDIAALAAILEEENDIAAVMLIPEGSADYLREVRGLTDQHSIPLVFDEVITGFRYAPGGAQEVTGVIPDLTVLAKILAGGLPGAAVAGRADLFDSLQMVAPSGMPRTDRRIRHYGTFNANPLSAAAGIACLHVASTGDAQRAADGLAVELATAAEAAGREAGVPVRTERQSSIVRLNLNGWVASGSELDFAFRRELTNRGVDPYPGAKFFVSAAHTREDIALTGDALLEGLRALRDFLPQSEGEKQ